MVKIASSTECVYLVGPAEGKLRPWCGHCHKFLKSETAPHDCTPVNLQAARKSSHSSGKKRNPKLTPKKIKILAQYLDFASIGKVMAPQMKRLQSAKTKKAKVRAVDAFNEAFTKAINNKIFSGSSNKMYHRFVK